MRGERGRVVDGAVDEQRTAHAHARFVAGDHVQTQRREPRIVPDLLERQSFAHLAERLVRMAVGIREHVGARVDIQRIGRLAAADVAGVGIGRCAQLHAPPPEQQSLVAALARDHVDLQAVARHSGRQRAAPQRERPAGAMCEGLVRIGGGDVRAYRCGNRHGRSAPGRRRRSVPAARPAPGRDDGGHRHRPPSRRRAGRGMVYRGTACYHPRAFRWREDVWTSERLNGKPVESRHCPRNGKRVKRGITPLERSGKAPRRSIAPLVSPETGLQRSGSRREPGLVVSRRATPRRTSHRPRLRCRLPSANRTFRRSTARVSAEEDSCTARRFARLSPRS